MSSHVIRQQYQHKEFIGTLAKFSYLPSHDHSTLHRTLEEHGNKERWSCPNLGQIARFLGRPPRTEEAHIDLHEDHRTARHHCRCSTPRAFVFFAALCLVYRGRAPEVP